MFVRFLLACSSGVKPSNSSAGLIYVLLGCVSVCYLALLVFMARDCNTSGVDDSVHCWSDRPAGRADYTLRQHRLMLGGTATTLVCQLVGLLVWFMDRVLCKPLYNNKPKQPVPLPALGLPAAALV